jgi:hypothetical protein
MMMPWMMNQILVQTRDEQLGNPPKMDEHIEKLRLGAVV